MSQPSEFSAIEAFFAPLTKGAPGTFALKNDAATIGSQSDRESVLTSDTLIAGVHFFPDQAPADIARKALRVNLSDLAAMGADAAHYLLALSLPSGTDGDWLRSFSEGLAQDQDEFGVLLIGGDTTVTPGPLTITITALGSVPHGQALTRSGAEVGDLVCVSGHIGDAGLALALRENAELKIPEVTKKQLDKRLDLPAPRLGLGLQLRGNATAALDVSDGLIADLDHICGASNIGISLQRAEIPLSAAAQKTLSDYPDLWPAIVSGGDDYELAFTISASDRAMLAEWTRKLGLDLAVIGACVPGEETRLLDPSGQEIALPSRGYKHF